MTINLARVDEFVWHLHASEDDWMPYLCNVAGEPYRLVNAIHVDTRDRSKVTCPTCLEWMHA